eukprot:TRINITY_DN24325_c0_g2_i1.p1 TRINITY_DN24325_c0_g2~~TRINITY_DN24325_c0_g2_i1.p1  ORF type:complete len:530 (-),score=51.39 TRINITY_DN24325_c0_g2_i1:217-1758(-)
MARDADLRLTARRKNSLLDIATGQYGCATTDVQIDFRSPYRGEGSQYIVGSPKQRSSVRYEESRRIDTYKRTLWLQVMLAFVTNMAIGMVIPTMPHYVIALGGETLDYYKCLGGTAICMFAGTSLLGPFVDGGSHRMLPAYVATTLVCIAGNVLYGVAGSISFLRSQVVLIVARCLVGAGASSIMLGMVFLGETCPHDERQKWVVRFGMTRSQGLFWGPPLGIGLASVTTSSTGLWGADTIPAWFQLTFLSLVVSALVLTWPSPPEHMLRSPLPPSASVDFPRGISDGHGSLPVFLRQTRVIAVLLSMTVIGTSQVATESCIPILTAAALQWTGPACGSPLSMMAVLLSVGQLTLLMLTNWGVEDRHTALVGVVSYTVVLLVSVAVWSLGVVSISPAGVLGPFLLLSFCGPFAMLSSFAVFLRLTVAEVPAHKGKCQALTQNLLAMTNLLGPSLLSCTYSGRILQQEKVPLTCFAWLGLAGALASICLCCAYRDLATDREIQLNRLQNQLLQA